jgi:diguanylate cyclase (GGDEF)-like protein/PAS domain S-box-containing protein
MSSKHSGDVPSQPQTQAVDLTELQIKAVETTANAVLIADREGIITWANASFERLTGYTREEAAGQSTRILSSGQNRRETYQQLWETILSGKTWSGELINRRKDGTLYDEEMNITPVQDSSGRITHFVAVKRDITSRKRAEKELAFKNALLQAQAETTIDGILCIDDKDRVILSNQRFAAMWGVPGEIVATGDDRALLQHVVSQITCPEEFLGRVKYLYEHREERSKDEIQLNDGRVFDRYSSALLDPHGEYLGRIWYFRDITEKIKEEKRSQLWARVLDQSAEGIFICDPQQHIVLVNRAFEQLTGYSADEALGKTPRLLHSGRQEKTFYEEMWKRLTSTGVWRGEIWNRRKTGEFFAEWLSISAVCDRDGRVTQYVGVFSDITARKQDQEQIVHLAQYDALTDLPNRALLLDRLNQMIKAAGRSNSKVAVIFIDLDRFKDVNDSLGHDAGDDLLRTLAWRLSKSVRSQDTVARMGGDEFVVAIQGLTDARDSVVIAQKLLSRLIQPVTVNTYELTVTASLGISVYPEDARDGQELIRNADAAMYQAKNAGRNAFRFYTSDLNKRALEMLSTENALRRAIDRHEFVLHYQPQIRISTGRVIGAEALIRWNHPESGLLYPGKFIPIAEERGLIVPIGSWVIEEASRQAALWQRSGRVSVPIAVNVSAVQFRQKDFIEQLDNTVRRHGITPAHLELELTESIVMRDAEATIEILNRLHEIGFQLSIDDFGTGYSSLNYLRRFPVDKIKIDQTFVADESAKGIVTAIIGLARNLNLKVIAEGVQTTAQLEMLRAQGCDEIQGFLIGHAVEPGEFERVAAKANHC